jgi:hypothetical protein
MYYSVLYTLPYTTVKCNTVRDGTGRYVANPTHSTLHLKKNANVDVTDKQHVVVNDDVKGIVVGDDDRHR